jgi:hypothetical protein
MAANQALTARRDYTVETLAFRVAKPETWIRTHAASIPGAYKLGRHWRFDSDRVEAWITAGADLDIDQ